MKYIGSSDFRPDRSRAPSRVRPVLITLISNRAYTAVVINPINVMNKLPKSVPSGEIILETRYYA